MATKTVKCTADQAAAALKTLSSDIVSTCVFTGDGIDVDQANYAAVNAAVSALPADFEAQQQKAALKAYAAAKRWAVETAGITVDGATIATDRDSQNMISGAYAYVTASKATEVEFKAVSGWITLTADQITAIALAVGAHVQGCFATEKAVDAEIDAGTITDAAGVDGASWPSND